MKFKIKYIPNLIGTANAATRNKKFAAYEFNKSTQDSTRSSSLSSISTPLLDQFSTLHIEPSNKIAKTNFFNKSYTSNLISKNNFAIKQFQMSQIACRLGPSCRFKRENKCRYYHPAVNKYKNEKCMEISDYTIDHEICFDINQLELKNKKRTDDIDNNSSNSSLEKISNNETYSSNPSLN